MSGVKKPKTYHFHIEWEEAYFFTMFRDKCLCLICRASVAIPKKGNLERHFSSLHKSYQSDFPANSEVRKMKLKELKTQLGAQQLLFSKPLQQSEAVAEASFRISRILVKHKKPFQDGEMVKEAFVEASAVLFDKFKNKSDIISSIKEMPLSRQTVTRRIEMMNEDVKQQLCKDLQNCSFFSLQFDESADIVDTVQLIVFVRIVFQNMTSKEEFLTILAIKGTARGQDIFNIFMEFAHTINLPLWKLVCITTDGAPSFVGATNGFIALCRKNDDFPDFTSFHCIIHQNALCVKVLNVKDIMDITVKIANSIRARSLRRRLFRSQLEENEADYEDLLLFTNVRWLSKGKFLERFLNLLPEIIEFLDAMSENFSQLQDAIWVQNLAFVTDLTGHYNTFNLELQGKGKSVTHLVSSLNAFKSKLRLLKSQLDKGNLKHFPNLEKHTSKADRNFDEYIAEIEALITEFERRFTDLENFAPILSFMSYSFGECDIEEISSNISSTFLLDSSHLESEILKLQSDIVLKARASDNTFWTLLSEDKYPCLRSVALRLTAFFGSTYLCEAAFSEMKIIKSKYRSCLTGAHLEACLRLCLSEYVPDYSKLCEDMQCHASTSQK